MRILLATFLATFLAAAPAHSQPGSVMWKNISTGMTYSDVQALYPAVKGSVRHKAGRIEIEGVAEIGKCRPNVTIYFSKDGVVRSVWLSARPRGFPAYTCADEAQQALVSKYGEPVLLENGVRGPFSGPTFTWKRDAITVRLERKGIDDWTIVYEPISTADV